MFLVSSIHLSAMPMKLLDLKVKRINTRVVLCAKRAIEHSSERFDTRSYLPLIDAIDNNSICGLLRTHDLLEKLHGQLLELAIKPASDDRDMIHAILKHFWFIEQAMKVTCFECDPKTYYFPFVETVTSYPNAHRETRVIDLVKYVNTRSALLNDIRRVIKDPNDQSNEAVFAAFILDNIIEESVGMIYALYQHRNMKHCVNIWTLGIALYTNVNVFSLFDNSVDPYFFIPIHSLNADVDELKPAIASMYSVSQLDLAGKFRNSCFTAEFPWPPDDWIMQMTISKIRPESPTPADHCESDPEQLSITANSSKKSRNNRMGVRLASKKSTKKPVEPSKSAEVAKPAVTRPNEVAEPAPGISPSKKSNPKQSHNKEKRETKQDVAVDEAYLQERVSTLVRENDYVKDALHNFLIKREISTSLIAYDARSFTNVTQKFDNLIHEIIGIFFIDRFDLMKFKKLVSCICEQADPIHHGIVQKLFCKITKTCHEEMGNNTVLAIKNYVKAITFWNNYIKYFGSIDSTLQSKCRELDTLNICTSFDKMLGLQSTKIFFLKKTFDFFGLRYHIETTLIQLRQWTDPHLQSILISPYEELERHFTLMSKHVNMLFPQIVTEKSLCEAKDAVQEILRDIKKLCRFIKTFSSAIKSNDTELIKRVLVCSLLTGVRTRNKAFTIEDLKHPFCARSFLYEESELSMFDLFSHSEVSMLDPSYNRRISTLDLFDHFTSLMNKRLPPQKMVSGEEFLEFLGVEQRAFMIQAAKLLKKS
ncbi:MAG: hypothetical protein LBB21_02280 [Holosporaceae bacterium]|nr:hypothetical protein [Holosporaceae bacterium]